MSLFLTTLSNKFQAFYIIEAQNKYRSGYGIFNSNSRTISIYHKIEYVVKSILLNPGFQHNHFIAS